MEDSLMADLELAVDPSVQQLFADLAIGVLVVEGLDNHGVNEDLRAEIEVREAVLRSEHSGGTLLELAEVAVWRDAYRAFGAKPKVSKPTAEALLRRVLQGNPTPRISDAVDAYLATELRYHLPIGGYDLDTLDGRITLTRARGGESFVPLGSFEPEEVSPGEVVYRDGARVLTRKWNYRDCDACKITESTTRLALFTELPQPVIDQDRFLAGLRDMRDLILGSCGGQAQTFLWTASGLSPTA